MLNIQNIEIKLEVPDKVKKEFNKLDKELSEIENKYSNIIGTSFKKKLIRKINFNSKSKKSELEKSLKNLKERLMVLYSTYYEDINFRKEVANCLDRINIICTEASIKPINVKVNFDKLSSLGSSIENSLKIIKNMYKSLNKTVINIRETAEKIKRNNKFFEDFSKHQIQLRDKVQEVQKFWIIVLKEKKLLEIKVNKNLLEKDYNEILKKFEKLSEEWSTSLEDCVSIPDWKIKYGILSGIIKKIDGFKGKVNKLILVKTEDNIIEDLKIKKGEIDNAIKELEKKIKFAEKLSKYKVFDNNMGIAPENALDSLSEMKSTKYGQYINCESQSCLEIAKGIKMQIQYDHKKGDTILGWKGPYYILVDEKSKVVSGVSLLGATYTTLNSSTNQPQAEQEVESYLKQALQKGSFKGISTGGIQIDPKAMRSIDNGSAPETRQTIQGKESDKATEKILDKLKSKLGKTETIVNKIDRETSALDRIQEELDKTIKTAKGYGINISDEEQLLISRFDNRFENKLEFYKEQLKKGSENKLNIEKLKNLNKEIKSYNQNILGYLSNINSNSETIKSYMGKLKENITFAKKLSRYKVFDNNMGIAPENALDSLSEMKSTKYGQYINCESQSCLEIAKSGKMKIQYDHSTDSYFSPNKGPYYIIVDESSRKVSDAYTTRTKSFDTTINSLSLQPQAEEEVQNYLKHALQEGKFNTDKNWLKPYK